MSGRSFLRGNPKVEFSMCHHACCKLASDWLLGPSLGRDFEPFFHLQLTLGRGNSLRTFLFISLFFFFLYFRLLFLIIFYITVNLQSKKPETIQIPLELHLSDDNEFVTNLLGHKKSDMSHQDSDSSL